jgi:hypothetical protein
MSLKDRKDEISPNVPALLLSYAGRLGLPEASFAV